MVFLEFLASKRTPFGEALFQGFTYLGQETFAVAVICWLFWCQNKKLGYTLGFSYFSSGLLVQGLKAAFRIPRPWVLNPDFKPVASALPAATGYSFPSGHTQSSTALFSTLALHASKRWQKAGCTLLFLLVGFSRMYLGCHTPKDVLTAMFISLGTSVLVYHLFYKRPCSAHRKPLGTAALLTGISLLLACYGFFLYFQGSISAENVADCIKASGAGCAFGCGYYIEETHIHFAPPKTFGRKLPVFLLGILITLAFQQGLKPFLGTSLPGSFLRYFITVLWIVAGAPLLIRRFSSSPDEG